MYNVPDVKLSNFKCKFIFYFRKSFPAQGMVTDSSDRTQYQPQVKIMKRPTDTPSTNNDKRFYILH